MYGSSSAQETYIRMLELYETKFYTAPPYEVYLLQKVWHDNLHVKKSSIWNKI